MKIIVICALFIGTALAQTIAPTGNFTLTNGGYYTWAHTAVSGQFPISCSDANANPYLLAPTYLSPTSTVLGPNPGPTTTVSCVAGGGGGASTSGLPASVKYASQLSGASLDVDVTNGNKIGGGTATNNLVSANAFLATATSAQPVILYIDGPMGIKGALDVGAVPNTTIECISGGSIYSLIGSNANTIQNGLPVPTDPGGTAPAKAGKVIIKNCSIYGNRNTYPNGNSTLTSNGVITFSASGGFNHERGGLGGYTLGTLAGTINASVTTFTLSVPVPTTLPQSTFFVIENEILNCTAYSGAVVSGCTRGASQSGWSGQSAAASHTAGVAVGWFGWYMGINLSSIANVLIDNVTIQDAPTYGIRLNNVTGRITNTTISNSVQTASQQPNTDGIHLSGPGNDIQVNNITYNNMGDDCFAGNFDEGFGGAGMRIQASNMTANNCAVGMRFYGNTFVDSQINVSNFSGSFRDKYLILGNSGVGSSVADGVKSLIVSDGIITSQSGNTMQHVVEIGDNVGSVTLKGIKWTDPNAAASAWFVPSANVNVSDLQLIDSQLYQTTVGSSTPYVLNVANSNFKKVTITGYAVTQQYGNSFAAVPYLVNNGGSGTVTQLALNHVDPTNIIQITPSAFAGITEVSGTGLSETGWYIPDAKVLKNGTYYLSFDQSVPVIKWGSASSTITASPALAALSGAHFAAATSPLFANNALTATSNTFTKPGATTSFTVFAFINATYGAGLQLPVSTLDASAITTDTSYYLGYFNSTNTFGFGTFDTANTGFQPPGTTNPTAATWYFLTGTHDATVPGARVNKIWVNGTVEGTLAAGASIYNGNAPLGVAGPANQGSNYSVNGKTAMVGKVSALLNSTQIAFLYNSGNGRSSAEVLAYFVAQSLPAPDFLYGFANGGSLGTDSSGHATTLTSVGTVTQGAGPH